MKKFQTALLCAILFFAFFTRIWRLEYPKTYVFDEVYHAVTAKLIARGDDRAFEWWNPAPEPNTAVDWLHPPFAKYTQALSILALGENSLGWRLSSALFGVGVIWLVYRLSLTAFNKPSLALLAAFLASLDGLLLVQSRIAMNDIHVTFFILLSLWLYWRKKATTDQPLTLLELLPIGASLGLALASKWSGLFALIIVGAWEGLTLLAQPLKLSSILQRGFSLLLIPLVIYVAMYTPMFLQGKSLVCTLDHPQQNLCYQEKLKLGEWVWYDGLVSHFVELHHQIWWYQTHLTATHPYQSRPWQWLTNTRPVWYFVGVQNAPNLTQNIYAMGNSIVFLSGAISVILLALLLLYQTQKPRPQFKLKKSDQQALLFLLVSYLVVWLPWQLSPRIMFFYHYTPAVPFLCIFIAYLLDKLSTTSLGHWLVRIFILLTVAFFILWYPHWTALTVPASWAQELYFALPSWK